MLKRTEGLNCHILLVLVVEWFELGVWRGIATTLVARGQKGGQTAKNN